MKQNRLMICFLIALQVLSLSQSMAHTSEVTKNRISKAISGNVQVLPFSPADGELNASWIKQRDRLNTNYLHQIDPRRLLHKFPDHFLSFITNYFF